MSTVDLPKKFKYSDARKKLINELNVLKSDLQAYISKTATDNAHKPKLMEAAAVQMRIACSLFIDSVNFPDEEYYEREQSAPATNDTPENTNVENQPAPTTDVEAKPTEEVKTDAEPIAS